MNITKIERLISGDERRLRAIRLRALADTPDAFATTYEEASSLTVEEWQRQLEQFATFVATAGAGDIGIVRGARPDNDNDTAYLVSMWVAPEMRRQGVAAALVDCVVEWASTEGYRRLVLDVVESNIAAMALYSMKGFVANGTLGTLPPPRQHIRECQLEKKLASAIE
jgi:GNAT superfamily N-acetyltransferase